MRRFRCDRCKTLLVLENNHCIGCGCRLAFVPELMQLVSWDDPSKLREERSLRSRGIRYRLCRNYSEHNICNWVVAADDPGALCQCCRTTTVIPDLGVAGNLERWFKLETAKRRLFVGLMSLGLPIAGGGVGQGGELSFQFLAETPGPSGETILTGHDNGLITINVAEADDDERERRRVALHEPYRTLLGHLRHEIGHYYWDRLIAASDRLAEFRQLFGDERSDYAEALAAHYENGDSAAWQGRFISAYAGSHPWEDWAETWAHYLHMMDSLETAFDSGLSLSPKRRADPRFAPVRGFSLSRPQSLDELLERWMSLTYILNDLNRGLGLNDAYPFVLSDPVIDKLRFVHDTVEACKTVVES